MLDFRCKRIKQIGLNSVVEIFSNTNLLYFIFSNESLIFKYLCLFNLFVNMSEEPLSKRRRIDTETFSWSLSEDGSTITIIGKGMMEDYDNTHSSPWIADCKRATKLIVSDGITSIGNYAFSCCSHLTSITFPNSLTSIGAAHFLSVLI